jgi:hypothetical protein
VRAHGNQGDNQGNETINAGNGNDTIMAGPGKNTINAGAGMDTIYGGPLGDTINLAKGNSNDTIALCGTSQDTNQPTCWSGYTSSTINLSSGAIGGVVYANNGFPGTINCDGSPATVYYTKGLDTVNRCPHAVKSAADPPADPPKAKHAAKAKRATKAKRAKAHRNAKSRSHNIK